MEKLLMSQKERVRLIVMQQVKQKELTLAQAREVLALSYRQTKRVWRRYRLDGDKGLVHRLRGRPGKRAKAAKLKKRILARYDELYPDFGPTLVAEYLAAEGMVVDHETLRPVAFGPRQTEAAPPVPAASAMARTQALLWRDGATGWFGS
jgi:hypothetical protein